MTQKNLKVAVIGGGSTYTPELINGFLARTASFPLTELVLMDINTERLEIVGGFAQRMVAAHSHHAADGVPFRVTLTDNQQEAVRDASYVCTQLRVGQMEARRADEYLGQRHGLIGQETTGVGGMAKALRTIPVILELARDMQALAPGALLVNFTNPAGLVTEALTRYVPGVSAVGVCNVPLNTKMHLLGLLEQELGSSIAPDRAELKTLGLNHLSWHGGFTLDGEDVWATVFERYCADQKEWNADTLRALQCIPNYYLQYYYHTAHKLAEQNSWPPSRAEQVQAIERDLIAYYANPDHTEPPADLMKRGGAYYSTVATQLLNSHYNDLNETHVVNVRHNGAVAGWDKDWVLEIPAQVGRGGVRPLPTAPLPPAYYGLLTQVKMYELLTVEAAVRGDRRTAYQALLAHPLGPSADQVQNVLDDMLATNRQHLPQFA
jgi:6-phospho-beta-glucosidase